MFLLQYKDTFYFLKIKRKLTFEANLLNVHPIPSEFTKDVEHSKD